MEVMKLPDQGEGLWSLVEVTRFDHLIRGEELGGVIGGLVEVTRLGHLIMVGGRGRG